MSHKTMRNIYSIVGIPAVKTLLRLVGGGCLDKSESGVSMENMEQDVH